MDHAIIPIEIVELIALSRPDAYFKLIQSCQRMYKVLSRHRETLLIRWIPRKKTNPDELTSIYANICPNGAFHGEYKVIQNGKISEVKNYRFGVLHGKWYWILGCRRTSCNYENGVLHGDYVIKGGGYNLELQRTTYVNGMKHGVEITQYISGGTESIKHYKNDVLWGEVVYFEPDRSTQPCCRENYVRGILDGERIFYDRKGRITRQELWNNGFRSKVLFTTEGWRNNYRIRMEDHNE